MSFIKVLDSGCREARNIQISLEERATMRKVVLCLVVVAAVAKSVAADCCRQVEVSHSVGSKDVHNQHPSIFASYVIEPDTVNGRAHYTSHDCTRAMSYFPDKSQWVIQDEESR